VGVRLVHFEPEMKISIDHPSKLPEGLVSVLHVQSPGFTFATAISRSSSVRDRQSSVPFRPRHAIDSANVKLAKPFRIDA
jgi:hypothetical protein